MHEAQLGLRLVWFPLRPPLLGRPPFESEAALLSNPFYREIQEPAWTPDSSQSHPNPLTVSLQRTVSLGAGCLVYPSPFLSLCVQGT